MFERVRVRLVPKTREGSRGVLLNRSFGGILSSVASPDPGRAHSAEMASRALGIETSLSAKSNIDGVVDRDLFQSVFKTELVQRTKEVRRTPEQASEDIEVREYLEPKAALEIPDELKDTVDFAYVPTPPDFHGISFVPPNTSLYHLRLPDVARALNVERCHRRGWTGKGIRIGMADSGFAKHPFFDQNGFKISRISTPLTSNPELDPVGHGTGECANALWMAPDSTLIGVKHDDYSAMALETTLSANPHVMTHSWGWNIDHQSRAELQAMNPNLFNELVDVEQIIADAIGAGVVTIFSAGNGHRAFPGSIPEVISAGGVTVQADGDLEASSYASSFVSELYPGRRVPDFCGVVGAHNHAPRLPGHIMLPVPNDSELEGDNLPASQANKGWGIFSGTSAAAPQLAGIAALILQINPDYGHADVKQVLADTARDVVKGMSGLGDPATVGPDLATGSGFVDAFSACLRAHPTL